MAYSPTLDIDPAHVLAAVGWPPPVRFSKVEGGWDTYMWRFQTEDERWHALRVYRPGPEGPNDMIFEAARREEASLRAIAAAGIPTAAVEASGTFDGLPVFVLSWLPGRALIDLLQTRTWRIRDYGEKFGRLHARLHTVQAPDLLHYTADTDWVGIVADPDVEAAVRERAVADTFCHFDFHPVNVLCDGREMTGVIDFSFSGIADRRADLGRTLAILVAAPIPPSPLRPILQFFRTQFAASWRRGYTKQAGDFPLEPVFEAWGAMTFLRNIEEAVAEGRGWGRPEDIEVIRRYVADRKRAAGLSA